MEKLNNASERQTDIDSAKIQKKMAETAIGARRAENLLYYSEQSRDLEHDFASRLSKATESTGQMTAKEFEKWEDEAIGYFDAIKKEIDESGVYLGLTGDLNLVAKEMAKIVAYMPRKGYETELATTIEAQAGAFYDERRNDLNAAIAESDLPEEEKQKDAKILRGFYPAVARHLDLKYMSPAEIMDYPRGAKARDDDRTVAHNDAIKSLNDINDLARKYGTRPFTARNFWPSDMCPKKSQSEELARIFRYDRDIVEEYYAIAFSSEVKRREARQAYERRRGSFYR